MKLDREVVEVGGQCRNVLSNRVVKIYLIVVRFVTTRIFAGVTSFSTYNIYPY